MASFIFSRLPTREIPQMLSLGFWEQQWQHEGEIFSRPYRLADGRLA
jgi:hypothetical protein